MIVFTSKLKRLLPLLASALLGACSIPLPGPNPQETVKPPPSFSALASRIPRVQNSPASPCWQQQQIAAQNAYLDKITTGKRVAYHAPCAATPPAAKPESGAAPDAPKTS